VNGTKVEGEEEVRSVVVSHFASHFKAHYVDRSGVDNLNFRTLSHVEGVNLIKPFSEDEVKAAIWNCDGYKSHGLNGIHFGFMKDLWTELKVDIMWFISEFHPNGWLSKGINSTFIALIPKVDSPMRLNEFYPISLVGSVYKILAKVLANRLQMITGSVISDCQSAFVMD